MDRELEPPIAQNGRAQSPSSSRDPSVPALPQESRIEACKAELSKAIGELAEGTKFNIVAFNYTVWKYQEQMSVASAPSVKAAQEWIAKLDAKTVTNIHDCLLYTSRCV